MEKINFLATKDELIIIGKIVDRAQALDFVPKGKRLDALMDIEAAHSNGTPLDLQKFLDFDDFNFLHDFCGIKNHINRRNGQIENCFLPRCAKPTQE